MISSVGREYINTIIAKMSSELLKVASTKSFEVIDCKVYKIVAKAAPKIMVDYIGIIVLV